MLHKLDHSPGGVWIATNLELKKGVQRVYFLDIGVNQHDFSVAPRIADHYASQTDACVFVSCNSCG